MQAARKALAVCRARKGRECLGAVGGHVLAGGTLILVVGVRSDFCNAAYPLEECALRVLPWAQA